MNLEIFYCSANCLPQNSRFYSAQSYTSSIERKKIPFGLIFRLSSPQFPLRILNRKLAQGSSKHHSSNGSSSMRPQSLIIRTVAQPQGNIAFLFDDLSLYLQHVSFFVVGSDSLCGTLIPWKPRWSWYMIFCRRWYFGYCFRCYQCSIIRGIMDMLFKIILESK
jgi:hypothetical protein